MKRYRLIISLLIIVLVVTSCSQSGNNGELVGASGRGKWFEPVPFGMTFIRRGSLKIGPSDQDPSGTINPTKQVSIDAFWMDDTEITNNEYRQFVYWVRDSIARTLLYNSSNPNAQYYGNVDDNNNFTGLNWDEKIDWEDTTSIETLFIPVQERFYKNRLEVDARKLFFSYSWIDYENAAKREHSYDYKTQSYGGGIADRSAFLHTNNVNIYPDTLCWIRDFSFAYNEPWTLKYFWHPGFDEYPVVGVNWEQANAFCYWRTKLQDDFFDKVGEATVQAYRLPTEFEWEYAAKGGLVNPMYPWGGYYARNQQGAFQANFKPLRGNYVEDGGLATMKVGSFQPNDFGLYDMAGNVAEWTITAYDELVMNMVNELNPNFQYNAQPDDPPALKRKVIRGGSWKDISLFINTSKRTFEYQDTTRSYIGFRCVRSSFGNDF
jgi:formylglycine-generating enzyme